MREKNKYQPIEDYGVIGDLRTIALVCKNGSIDFLCFPNFDSPSVFAALLDSEKGGYFQICPLEEKIKRKQIYLPDTNILLTRFLFDEGIGEITDFMPVATFCDKNIVFRSVINIKGKISYRMKCCPRFNYAKSSHIANLHKNSIIFTSKGENKLCLKLTSSVPLHIEEGDGYAEFSLNAGEKAEFILETIEDQKKSPIHSLDLVEKAFTQTLNYWKEWSAKSTYNGRWREMVIRSALDLNLLISSQYGTIVAAPTFGLPEKIGGSKNWDYRFGWIRDAAFTIRSLMLIGYKDEAESFMGWIEKICTGLHENSALKPLYALDGKKVIKEIELSYFEGYMDSYPVRLGNKASKQLQLDIYGEFIDSIYLFDKHVKHISHATWQHLSSQINWVMENWGSKDSSIWETRGEPHEYLYSRIMCWVAMDRAIRLGNRHLFLSLILG